MKNLIALKAKKVVAALSLLVMCQSFSNCDMEGDLIFPSLCPATAIRLAYDTDNIPDWALFAPALTFQFNIVRVNGKPVSSQSAGGPTDLLINNFEYDANGNLAFFRTFDSDDLTSPRSIMQFTYSAGAVNSYADNIQVDHYYLNLTETDYIHEVIQLHFSQQGDLLRKFTPGNGLIQYFEYNADRNLVRILDGNIGSTETEVSIEFTAYDNHTHQLQTERVWQILACNTSKNNPLHGIWHFYIDGHDYLNTTDYSYTYNNAGLPLEAVFVGTDTNFLGETYPYGPIMEQQGVYTCTETEGTSLAN